MNIRIVLYGGAGIKRNIELASFDIYIPKKYPWYNVKKMAEALLLLGSWNKYFIDYIMICFDHEPEHIKKNELILDLPDNLRESKNKDFWCYELTRIQTEKRKVDLYAFFKQEVIEEHTIELLKNYQEQHETMTGTEITELLTRIFRVTGKDNSNQAMANVISRLHRDGILEKIPGPQPLYFVK